MPLKSTNLNSVYYSKILVAKFFTYFSTSTSYYIQAPIKSRILNIDSFLQGRRALLIWLDKFQVSFSLIKIVAIIKAIVEEKKFSSYSYKLMYRQWTSVIVFPPGSVKKM